MLLDIKLIKSDSMFCIESAAASVAKWLNRNYEMMFAGLWGFDLLPENPECPEVIGKRVTAVFTEEDMLKSLKIYHGIQVGIHKIERVDRLVTDVINELKKGRPVAISLNESFLSLPDQKKNLKGFILLNGYKEDEAFFYIDVHNNSEGVKQLQINDLLNVNGVFENHFDNFFTFSIVSNENKKIDYEGFQCSIRNCQLLINDPFKSMRCLAERIAEKLDFDLERCDADNLYYVPLLYNIMHVSRARKLISTSANYIWEITNNPVLQNLSMDFLEMGYEWNQVWNMLFKLFYLSKDYNKLRNKIANKIIEIAEKEESLITRIVRNEYDYVHNVFINRKIEEVIEVKENNNILILDIKKYLNNKAFALNEYNEEKADFTGQGEFFLSHDLPDGGVIEAAGMKFMINSNHLDYDNIVCSNQIISLPQANYRRIMFLGCSEWGDGLGPLKVIYKNGHNTKILFYLPDWYNNKVMIDVVRVWKGKIVGLNNNKEERSLFALSYLVNQNEEIIEIQLPNIQNMHIFAISLEKCT